MWRGLAEVAEKYLKKGSQIYLEGKIRTRTWDDKEGNKRYTTEIIADTFTMLGKRDDTAPQSNNIVSEVAAPPVAPGPDDDLPF